MKYSKAVLLAIMLGLTSGIALAEGVYVAGDIGQGNAPDGCDGFPSTMTCSNTTTAFRAGLGFQVNKNVGLEVQYVNGGTIKAYGTNLGYPASSDSTVTGVEFSVLGALPLNSTISLLGKIGLAMLKGEKTVTDPTATATTSADNTNMAYGVGIRFAANEKIAFRVMYENYGDVKVSNTRSGRAVSIMSAGLQIGF